MEEPTRNEIKKGRAEHAIQNRRKRWIGWTVGIILIVGALIFSGIWYAKHRTRNVPGKIISDQGRKHITTTDHPPYNSNPPTSGWHFPQPAEWGVYQKELLDETLIHNLEHGGIWISYHPRVGPKMIAELEHFYAEFGSKIIITPRAANDSDIALAAWDHLDKFSVSEYSDDRVAQFIEAFRNKGPEFVP